MQLYPATPYDYTSATDDLIFTAGACPLDASGIVVSPGDRQAQADRCVDNLLAALAVHGAGGAELLKTTIYVVATDRSHLTAVWEVVAARLGRTPSTLLGVAVLGWPGQLVEIEAIARRPEPVPPPR
ncbi:MAG TPA: RidA family protein [Candidatus Binatia bacterium]|nr:RidA family protein [Candidatus Binatia bacterium]